MVLLDPLSLAVDDKDFPASLSIRPSYGARGEEILDGGGGRGRSFSPFFASIFPLFPRNAWQKSFASHFRFRRKRNKRLPRASASLREKFLSSTYVLVGKSIDDIDHEYFVREARRSLYFFKT